MLLAAGEILQHCAHGVRLADAQVDLDARIDNHGGLGVALYQDLTNGGQGGQGRSGFGRVLRHCDEVQITDGFLPAAQRTGRGDAHQPSASVEQLGGHRGAGLGGDAQGRAVGPHPLGLDVAQDVCHGALAHARQLFEPSVGRGLLQFGDGADAQLVHGGFHGLGPHAGDFQHLQDVGRQLLSQAVIGGHVARRHVLLDLFTNGLADARDFLQVITGGSRGGQRPAELFDGVGGALVGANLEDGVALDLQHGGHVVEQLDDVFVGDLRRHGQYLTTGQQGRARRGSVAQSPGKRRGACFRGRPGVVPNVNSASCWRPPGSSCGSWRSRPGTTRSGCRSACDAGSAFPHCRRHA